MIMAIIMKFWQADTLGSHVSVIRVAVNYSSYSAMVEYMVLSPTWFFFEVAVLPTYFYI